MSLAASQDWLSSLRADLEAHLARLDAERGAVARAIRALSPSPAPRVRSSEARREAVLDGVRAEPGIRCSMLALVLAREAGEVGRELHALEAVGIIERAGLGWRPVTAARGAT